MASIGNAETGRPSKRRKGGEASPAWSTSDGGEAQEIEVCFGMIVDLPVQTALHPSYSAKDTEPVLLNHCNKLHRPGEAGVYGTVSERSARIIYALREAGCTTQLFCQAGQPAVPGDYNDGKVEDDTGFTLCAILYGPRSMSEVIGDWLVDYGLFLQDPVHCDINVIYENPHLLCGEDEEAVMTFSLSFRIPMVQTETLTVAPNLFEILNQDHDLLETEQPGAVATPLHSHQKQALTFMLKREEGLAYDEPGKDVWSRGANVEGNTVYTNTVTGQRRQSEPPNFRAGLLADQMGLGKSLSIISLIVANQYQVTRSSLDSCLTPVKTTLLVVPLPLLQTWETQLSTHLHPNTLSWRRFHGPNKPLVDQLRTFDVVITTYKTVALQWKIHKNETTRSASLFSLYWHRIVLDEAHIIQNRSAAITKAACALEAEHRWAVTGTPIQNRLTDLASLFQFLQIYPYSNPLVFDREILRSWQKNDNEGCLRVKLLVNFVTLYRTTAIISLPPRNDLVHYLDFNPAESRLYESTRIRAQQVVKDAIGNPRKGVYMNALQWINQLRLICNHGTMQLQRMAENACTKGNWSSTKAQDMFESMLDAGNALCAMCSLNLADATLEDVSANATELPQPKLSECLHLVCGSCLTEETESTRCPVCQPIAHCRGYKVSFSPIVSSPSSSAKTLPTMSAEDTPTKAFALLASLKSFRLGEKSVVFSYWTYTLSLIELALISNSINYTRVDGQLSPNRRNQAIQKFQEDPTIQVILVSITCGGAGLDLTAGSVVYLMEPQWNPIMEEQALCRVHRMGQKNEVTTIRYRMKKSFEEKVVTIQERKKDLAALTFSNEKVSEADVGAARLQYLQAAL